MRNQKRLLIEQLDRKLKPFIGTERIPVPEKGWINNIRIALNMTLEQLGHKLKMTRQGINKIEERESSGAISIKSLREMAVSLDMHFVYAFVPKDGSIEKLIDIKAEALARKIVLRTNQNMKLENQGNDSEQIKQAITDLASEMKREMNRLLWD